MVFPEPDTPVMTVSFPLGKSASSGLHGVQRPSGEMNAAQAQRARPSGVRRAHQRLGPASQVWPDHGKRAGCPVPRTVPWAMICNRRRPRPPGPSPRSSPPRRESGCRGPPAAPNCHPPPDRASRRSARRCWTGCSPMEGSSSTYSTPVVRLRTERASCIRWRSPVERVEEARSRVR